MLLILYYKGKDYEVRYRQKNEGGINSKQDYG